MGFVQQVSNMQQSQTQGYNNNQQQNQQNYQQNVYNNGNNGGQLNQGFGGGNSDQMFSGGGDSNQNNMYPHNSLNMQLNNNQFNNNGLIDNNNYINNNVNPNQFSNNGFNNYTTNNQFNNNNTQYDSYGNNNLGNGLNNNNNFNNNQYGFNANNNNNGYGMNNNPYDQQNNLGNNNNYGNNNLLALNNNNNTNYNNYGNNGQMPMNYNQIPMNNNNNFNNYGNNNNNFGNPNNNYPMNINNGQMINQQRPNVQIDPLRMNQRINSTPQTPIDNFSDSGCLSPRSSTSFDSTQSNVETEAVRVVFPLQVDYNDVLFQLKLSVPDVVGKIHNEEKIKPLLTTNKKKQLIWINITTQGIAKTIKDKCSGIKFNNQPLEITVDNPKKKAQGVFTIPISGIKAVALDKFFSTELRRELLSQMSGGNSNSFEFKEKSIIFTVQPTQPTIPNVQQHLQNLVIKLLQPARFVEFYYENTNEKKDLIEKKLPVGVYLYVEESKSKYTTWYLTSLSDIYNNQFIIDLFKIKFTIPKEDFNFTKKELDNKNIQFKFNKQNENIQIDCTLRNEGDYKVFTKLKKGDTKKPVTIETTEFKFLKRFSSHLLKVGQTELKSKRDDKDPNKMIVFNVSKKARQLIQAEIKKIKSIKLELPFIHSSLKDDTKKEAEKYFEQLSEIQIVSTILAPEKSRNIIIFFGILENLENESKIRNELTELLKGSSEIVPAKQANDILLKKLSAKTKIEKFKKDISAINIDYDATRKIFFIKGLRDEDVKEVKSRIESELAQSKEKRIKLTFNNIIEKTLALPLLRSVQQNSVKILEQGLSITLVASSQDMYKFIDNSYHRVMLEVRKKVLVDFITMQHDEFKFFSEKNMSDIKGKIVLEKNLDSGIKQVHKIGQSFIYIAQGDMFDKKWRAQVLVNSANEQLSHGGGIAAQCLEKCGKHFDDECKKITNSRKLNTTEVIPTNTGYITHLSKIYNAIPPVYNATNHAQSCQLLQQTVINILNQAEKDGYCSIIIPALSSGIFGFPLDQATDIIVRTIYSQAKQLSCLKEIILIGDINNVTEAFAKSINSLQTDLVYTHDAKNDSTFNEIEQDEYVGCFKYFDDIKKVYLPFTVNDNRKLCEQYEKDPKSTFILMAEQGKQYNIDFDKMEQTEISSKFKRKIIYVPTMDSEYVSALWFWIGDDNKTWYPYRENQMKEIERNFNETNAECNVLMTNEKYKAEDIKYYVRYDYSKGDHVQINSQTQYGRKVMREPVIKIVKSNIDIASDNLTKNSILYVYAQDDTYYTFVSGSVHKRILITDTAPIQIIKSVNKSKYVSVTESVYSFRIYGELSDIQSFNLSFRQNIRENYITENLTKSCNKFIIDHVLSEHASMKHKVDKGILKLDMSSSPFTITGFKYSVDKFKEYALLAIADKPELLGKFSYPQEWQPQPSNVLLVNLSQSSGEWKMVVDRIKQTLPNAVIQKIEKVQNQLVYQSYKTEQDRINKIKIDSNGQYSTDPLLLFHGTRNTDPSIIYDGHEGFDMRFSNAGMWGVGCYFAVNSRYSNDYAYTVPGTNLRQFFLAEVLTGDYHSCPPNSSIRVPPLKSNSNVRYDSVKGNTGGSDVFIVYKNSQAYPKYFITYSLQ